MKTKTILIVSGIGVGLGVAYLLYKKFNKSIKLEEELTDLSTLKQKKSKLTLDEKKELFKKANTFAGIDFFGDEQARANYVKENPEQREGLPVPIDEGTIGNIQIGRGGL